MNPRLSALLIALAICSFACIPVCAQEEVGKIDVKKPHPPAPKPGPGEKYSLTPKPLVPKKPPERPHGMAERHGLQGHAKDNLMRPPDEGRKETSTRHGDSPHYDHFDPCAMATGKQEEEDCRKKHPN